MLIDETTMGCTQGTNGRIKDDLPSMKNPNNTPKPLENGNGNGNSNGKKTPIKGVKNAIDFNSKDGSSEAAHMPKNNYIGLTNKDIYSLKASWKAIRRNMEETGVLMFVK